MEERGEKDSSERLFPLPLLLLLHCPPPPSADTPVGSPGMECHRVIAKVALLLLTHRGAPSCLRHRPIAMPMSEGVTFIGTAGRAGGRLGSDKQSKGNYTPCQQCEGRMAVGVLGGA